MKKITFLCSIYLLVAVGFVSCSKNDNLVYKVSQDIEVQDFVWKGMNSWYNWQSSVENLANTKDNNQDNYVSYLNE